MLIEIEKWYCVYALNRGDGAQGIHSSTTPLLALSHFRSRLVPLDDPSRKISIQNRKFVWCKYPRYHAPTGLLEFPIQVRPLT